MLTATIALVLLVPAGLVGLSKRRARLTRPAVPGGERRDFFGDGISGQRRELA